MSLRGQQTGATSLDPTMRFIVVTMGARFLAFDADSVEGLLTIEVAGKAGFVIVQGVTYTPVDLAGRLSLQAEEDGPDTRVVLLDHCGLHGSVRVAQVHGLRTVELSQVRPLPRQFHGEEQNWYRGLIVLEGVVVLVLNMSWVLHGAGAGQRKTRFEWQERAPRVIAVRSELVIGKVQEC